MSGDCQKELTNAWLTQQKVLNILVKRDTLSDKYEKARATKSQDDCGNALWKVTHTADGSEITYPETATESQPEAFLDLFIAMGELGYWAALDPSDKAQLVKLRAFVKVKQ